MPVHAIGDIDGDKLADAAVMLVESSGGTGRFYYLFVLMNRGGTLVQIEQPEWLGDRSVIRARDASTRGSSRCVSSRTATRTRRVVPRGTSKTATAS